METLTNLIAGCLCRGVRGLGVDPRAAEAEACARQSPAEEPWGERLGAKNRLLQS